MPCLFERLEKVQNGDWVCRVEQVAFHYHHQFLPSAVDPGFVIRVHTASTGVETVLKAVKGLEVYGHVRLDEVTVAKRLSLIV